MSEDLGHQNMIVKTGALLVIHIVQAMLDREKNQSLCNDLDTDLINLFI